MLSSITIYGALIDVNAALSSVHYTPPLNWNSVMGKLDILSVSAASKSKTVSVRAQGPPAKIPIFVMQVNDAPQVQLEPVGGLRIDEDQVGIVNISITDVDAEEASLGIRHSRSIVNVTLKVNHGSLQIKESLAPVLYIKQLDVSR